MSKNRDLQQKTFKTLNQNQYLTTIATQNEEIKSHLPVNKTIDKRVLKIAMCVAFVVSIGVILYMIGDQKKLQKKEAYRMEIEDKASKLIALDDYENAIMIYKNAKMESDDSYFDIKVAETENEYKVYLETSGKEKYLQGQYVDALHLYKTLESYFVDLSYNDLMREILEEYKDVVVESDIESLLAGESVQDLNDSVNDVECVPLKRKIINYLCNRENWDSSESSICGYLECLTNEVEVYISDVALNYHIKNAYFTNFTILNFNIDNRFEIFRAKLEVVSESELFLKEYKGVKFDIYGDGELLYTTSITQNEKGEREIYLDDLAQYKVLTLYMEGLESDISNYEENTGKCLCIVLSDPVLYK